MAVNFSEMFDEMLDLMDRAFRAFENPMPDKPQLVYVSSRQVFRFKEQGIYQAMIEKLARVQSTVRAAKLLLENGFAQEQMILHRIIDETNEDIMFLGLAVTNDEITELHKSFLDAFWKEEIDESGSEQTRPMIRREKIRSGLKNRSTQVEWGGEQGEGASDGPP